MEISAQKTKLVTNREPEAFLLRNSLEGPRSSRMSSGFTYNDAEHYVERFTVTQCSEKLVTTHGVTLLIRAWKGLKLR